MHGSDGMCANPLGSERTDRVPVSHFAFKFFSRWRRGGKPYRPIRQTAAKTAKIDCRFDAWELNKAPAAARLQATNRSGIMYYGAL
jgi:hypothetical protein